MRAIRLGLLTVCCVIVYFFLFRELTQPDAIPQIPPIPTSELKFGPQSPLSLRAIPLNEPMELDYLTREEIYQIRSNAVNKNADLLKDKYRPSEVFEAIVDGKPWWGIDGQFCKGSGQESILGESEETRFILNPFLLLGIDEARSFSIEQSSCRGFYPQPSNLFWDAKESKAEITYDITQFLKTRQKLPINYIPVTFYIVDYNARDFGFNYIYADPKQSHGVSSVNKGQLFKNVCLVRKFIHIGGSCGYPGGCNNASPNQPEFEFKVKSTPAVMTCKLWKNRPAKNSQVADFTFVIRFE